MTAHYYTDAEQYAYAVLDAMRRLGSFDVTVVLPRRKCSIFLSTAAWAVMLTSWVLFLPGYWKLLAIPSVLLLISEMIDKILRYRQAQRIAEFVDRSPNVAHFEVAHDAVSIALRPSRRTDKQTSTRRSNHG